MCTDDDDEWTEVSTSQLLQQTATADTVTADTQVPDVAAMQHSHDAVKSSDDTQTLQTSLSPAAVAATSSCHSQQADDLSSVAAASAESCSSDVRGAVVDSAATASSTDHDSQSSDHTKTDSLVVVSITERTSPSDESSNNKGLLLSASVHALHVIGCQRLLSALTLLVGHKSGQAERYLVYRNM